MARAACVNQATAKRHRFRHCWYQHNIPTKPSLLFKFLPKEKEKEKKV